MSKAKRIGAPVNTQMNLEQAQACVDGYLDEKVVVQDFGNGYALVEDVPQDPKPKAKKAPKAKSLEDAIEETAVEEVEADSE